MKVYTSLADIPLPDKHPEHHAKINAFFKQVPGWARSYRCQPVQIIWNKQMMNLSGKLVSECKQSAYLCHYHYVNGIDQFTSYTYNVFTTQTAKNHIAYYNWLLSDESPYRALFASDDIFLLRDEKTGNPLLIGTTKFETMPVALWSNFLIASRLAAGWALSHVWQYLIDNGFDKTEAIAIAVWFYFNNEKVTINSTRDSRHSDNFREENKLNTTSPNYSDQPFNSHPHGGVASIKKLIKAEPDARAFTIYAKGGRANPCNNIWDERVSVLFAGQYHNNVSLDIIRKSFNDDKPLDPAFVTKIRKSIEEGKSIV